jgi:hypothetical protein
MATLYQSRKSPPHRLSLGQHFTFMNWSIWQGIEREVHSYRMLQECLFIVLPQMLAVPHPNFLRPSSLGITASIAVPRQEYHPVLEV